MRKAATLLALVLLSFSAAAGTITSIDPDTINVNSGEYFIDIYGTDLGEVVRYSGPAGTFDVEASTWTSTHLIVWVPIDVIEMVGDYDVVVLGGPTGDSAPATLSIVDPGGPPLTVIVPELVIAEATGPLTVVHLADDVGAFGGPDPNPIVTCDPVSGSSFPIGPTTVTCTATNSFGDSSVASFDVTVYDITPPVLSLPGNMVVAATDASGSIVNYTATASDNVDSVTANCNRPSGSLFPVGVTTVECTAEDLSFNGASGSFTVTVADTTAPVISAVTATPNVIKPANNKMVAVAIGVSVTDNIDATPACSVVNITSPQPISGDFTINGPLSVSLRAERTGNVNRVYTVHVSCSDDSGNSSSSSVNVTVTK